MSGELKEGVVVSRQALFWQLSLTPLSASFGVGTFEGCLRKDLTKEEGAPEEYDCSHFTFC